jgi:hypothetical protein
VERSDREGAHQREVTQLIGAMKGDEVTNATDSVPTEPKGIGGWLILPMLWTLFSPMLAIRGIVEIVSAFDGDLTSGLKILLISECIFNLCLVIGWIVAAVQLFKHKRSFPSLFITMTIVSFAGPLVDAFVAIWIFEVQLRPSDYGYLGLGLTIILIGTPYMARSKRVRNTFIVS